MNSQIGNTQALCTVQKYIFDIVDCTVLKQKVGQLLNYFEIADQDSLITPLKGKETQAV